MAPICPFKMQPLHSSERCKLCCPYGQRTSFGTYLTEFELHKVQLAIAAEDVGNLRLHSKLCQPEHAALHGRPQNLTPSLSTCAPLADIIQSSITAMRILQEEALETPESTGHCDTCMFRVRVL